MKTISIATRLGYTRRKGVGVTPLQALINSATDAVYLDPYDATLNFTSPYMDTAAVANGDAVGLALSKDARGTKPRNFFDYAGPISGADFGKAGTASGVPYWNGKQLGFFNIPDITGSDAGKGFTCTGLDYDGTNFVIGNDGRVNGADATFSPTIEVVSKDGASVASINVLTPFPSCESVQGVAVDKGDGTYWFVDLTAATIHHIQTDGTDLADDIALAGVNGVCDDSTRDRLWAFTTDRVLYRYTKAGVQEHSIDLSSKVSSHGDMISYDPEYDWIYITDGANTAPGNVWIYDIAANAIVGYFVVAGATSIEGVVRIGDVLCIAHDGYYHQGGSRLNQVQIYSPFLEGKAFGQHTATKKPTLSVGGGESYFAVDGGDHLLSREVFAYGAGSATLCVLIKGASQVGKYILAEVSSLTATQRYLIGLTGLSNGARAAVYIRNDAGSVLVNSTATGTLLNSADHVLTAVDTGAALEFYIDGVAAGTASYTRSGVMTVDQMVLFAYRNLAGESDFLTASVGRMILLGGIAANAAQRALLETAVAAAA